MRTKMFAVLMLAAVVVSACSSNGEVRSDGAIDPGYQAQLDGFANGSVPRSLASTTTAPPAGGTYVVSTTTPPSPLPPSTPSGPANCLATALNALVEQGKLTQSDLASWLLGGGRGGPVDAAAGKIISDGTCAP